jgi:DNA-binding transcriptional MerR regulator
MEPPASEWSVRDLAELAGTTVRTIHYYISEGLLPPPAGATRNATYSAAHLARLRLIAALRDEGLALASIRQRLSPLTDQQAIEVAGELDRYLDQPGEPPLSTLGLIEAALATRNQADLLYDMDAPSASAPSAPPVSHASIALQPEPSPGSASEYLQRVMRRASIEEIPPKPTPRQMPRLQPPRKPIESERPELWYHIKIADGVELRVREDRFREAKGRLRAVTDTVRTALNRYGLGDPEG